MILFAPGAGAPSTSAWMERWANLLASIAPVRRFDYPYALAGRRAPDRLPKLIEAHAAALSPGDDVLVGMVVDIDEAWRDHEPRNLDPLPGRHIAETPDRGDAAGADSDVDAPRGGTGAVDDPTTL